MSEPSETLRHPDDLWNIAMRSIFPLPDGPEGKLPIGNNTAANNIRFLAEYFPEMLDRVVAACADSELLRVWQSKLQKEVLHTPDPWEYEESLSKYERLLAVLPTASRLAKYDLDNTDPLSSIFLIDNAVAQLLRVSKIVETPPADVLSAIAIVLYVRGAYSLHKYTSGSTIVTYSDIEADVNWVSRHIGEVEPHVTFLLKRQSHDHRLIEDLIESGSVPIADGVL